MAPGSPAEHRKKRLGSEVSDHQPMPRQQPLHTLTRCALQRGCARPMRRQATRTERGGHFLVRGARVPGTNTRNVGRCGRKWRRPTWRSRLLASVHTSAPYFWIVLARFTWKTSLSLYRPALMRCPFSGVFASVFLCRSRTSRSTRRFLRVAEAHGSSTSSPQPPPKKCRHDR